ncbi:MAG: hypothetical protein FJ030_03310 [Chloroflexi bacterium]|nr:hypothetical protein [Chloroflexota bacterium]
MEVKAGFKETEVGVIPEDWEVRTIAQIAPLQRGFDLPSSKLKDGIYPVVYSNGITNHHDNFMVRSPGVVTGRSGTLGKIHYVEEDFWPHNTSLWVTRFNGNFPKFIYYLYTFIGFERFGSGSGVPTLNRNDAHEFRVSFPPSPTEQEAIAEALSDADALIEALEQLLAKKRQVKQGAMQELLTGKKRVVESGKWEVKSFGELFNISGGLSASRDQLSSEGHCYLHYGDIHLSNKSFIDVKAEFQDIPKLNVPLNKVSTSSLLNDGDIVFVDASEDDEGASKHVVVVNPDGIPYISGLHTIVAKSKTDELNNLYKRYCFQTRAVKKQFLFYSVGTKVTGISKTNIAKITLPVPSVPEQTAIAEILSDMDAEIAALEAKLSKAREVKAGMMSVLLSGQLRVYSGE